MCQYGATHMCPKGRGSEWNVVLGEGRLIRGTRARGALAGGRERLVIPWGAAEALVIALATRAAFAGARASLATQELHGLRVNFGRVFLHAGLVFPLTGLEAAFEINLAALREVLVAELGELA